MKPLRRPGLGFGDWLTNFATGSWFSVLMTSSPGAHWGINSFSSTWASSMAIGADMTRPPFSYRTIDQSDRLPWFEISDTNQAKK